MKCRLADGGTRLGVWPLGEKLTSDLISDRCVQPTMLNEAKDTKSINRDGIGDLVQKKIQKRNLETGLVLETLQEGRFRFYFHGKIVTELK